MSQKTIYRLVTRQELALAQDPGALMDKAVSELKGQLGCERATTTIEDDPFSFSTRITVTEKLS